MIKVWRILWSKWHHLHGYRSWKWYYPLMVPLCNWLEHKAYPGKFEL